MTVAPDGCLRAALERLYAAVAKLLDPVKEWQDDRMLSREHVLLGWRPLFRSPPTT